MRSVADRNVVMQRIPVYSSHKLIFKTQPKQLPRTHTNVTKTSDFPTALTQIPSLHKARSTTWYTSRWRSLFNVTSVQPRQRWHRKQTDVCGNATLSQQHCPGYRRCYGPSSSRSRCIDVLANEKVDFKQHLIAVRIINVNRGQKNWRIRVLRVHLTSVFIFALSTGPKIQQNPLQYSHASLNDGDTFWEMRR